MRAHTLAVIIALAAASPSLPSEGSVEKKGKELEGKTPSQLPHESPPSGAEFRVANRCAQKATLTYPKVRAVVDVPTWRGDVEALGDVSIPCLDGRPLKVQLEATSDLPACEAWADSFDCHSESGGATVVIECDSATAIKCAAREVHAQCVGWGSMAGFCPARSTAIAGPFHGTYQCGGGSYLSDRAGPLDATTLCPLCQCAHDTKCIGNDCDACGGVVSRSADAACVPSSWAAAYSSSSRPTAPPHMASHGGDVISTRPLRSDDDDDDGTLAPTPFGAASADASSTAAILIALVAAAITACAIRQAIVKRRKREALGGAQFVDVPSRPPAMRTSMPSIPNPLRGSKGGYDQIGDAVEMGKV